MLACVGSDAKHKEQKHLVFMVAIKVFIYIDLLQKEVLGAEIMQFLGMERLARPASHRRFVYSITICCPVALPCLLDMSLASRLWHRWRAQWSCCALI